MYIFVTTTSGETWSQYQKLEVSDGAASDFFGRSVSMHGDTLAVGSVLDDDKGTDSGL